MEQKNNLNIEKGKKKLAKTNLSVASLILTILQLIIPFITLLSEHLNFLESFPYLVVALILAIISKCKYDDDLSLIMIVVDSVLIVVAIIFMILTIIFFMSAIEAILSGCDFSTVG